jgi:hypothetical protein
MPKPTAPSTAAKQPELPLPADHGQKLNGFSGIAIFLRSIADLYKQADYGLPMTVLRSLDCVLRDANQGAREGRGVDATKFRVALVLTDYLVRKVHGDLTTPAAVA